LAAYLRQLDQHAQQMARHGEWFAPEIALSAGDYALIDESVRTVSNGRFRASTVMWNGRPLRRHVAAVAA
jgi:hypothetical protein